MNRYQIIDADSQFTEAFDYVSVPWIPHKRIKLFFDSEKRGLGHSIFGEHHDLYPLAASDLEDRQLQEIVEDINKIKKSFTRDTFTIVTYPNDSTIHSIVHKIIDQIGEPDLILGLSPAFTHNDDFQLRVELNMESKNITDVINVIFLDDSYSSGKTEGRAIVAILDALQKLTKSTKALKARMSINWYTYVLVDRSNARIFEVRTLQSKKMDVNLMPRNFYFELSPKSARQNSCPMCSASSNIRKALVWAAGTRAEIRSTLEQASQFYRPTQLFSTFVVREKIMTWETKLSLLFLFSEALYKSCFYITEKKDWELYELEASLFFLCFNWHDCCAFIARDKLIELYRDLINQDSPSDYYCARITCITLSLLPSSIQYEVLHGILLDAVNKKRLTTVGVLIALSFSGISELQRDFTAEESRKHEETLAKKIRNALSWELTEQINILSKKAEFFQRCEVLRCDLAALSDHPKISNPLWCMQMLTAILHGGKHASFLLYQLNEMLNPDMDQLKNNITQCINLMRQLLDSIGTPDSVEYLATLESDICKKTKIEEIRYLVNSKLIEPYWTNNIETQFVTDGKRLEDIIKNARTHVLAKYDKLENVSTNFFALSNVEKCDRSWRMFAPAADILLDLFTNLLGNPIKHYYEQDSQGISELCMKLLKDATFVTGGTLVWVQHKVISDNGAYYILFADRAACAEGKNLFWGNSGLSSSKAHLQLKGGDLVYFSKNDVSRGLPGEWAVLTPRISVLPNEFNNLFIIKIALLLTFK